MNLSHSTRGQFLLLTTKSKYKFLTQKHTYGIGDKTNFKNLLCSKWMLITVLIFCFPLYKHTCFGYCAPLNSQLWYSDNWFLSRLWFLIWILFLVSRFCIETMNQMQKTAHSVFGIFGGLYWISLRFFPSFLAFWTYGSSVLLSFSAGNITALFLFLAPMYVSFEDPFWLL